MNNCDEQLQQMIATNDNNDDEGQRCMMAARDGNEQRQRATATNINNDDEGWRHMTAACDSNELRRQSIGILYFRQIASGRHEKPRNDFIG